MSGTSVAARRPLRAVYDAMVLLQAIGGESGPGAACMSLADLGKVELWASDLTLRELGKILSRVSVRQRFPRITDERAYQFLLSVRARSKIEPNPPHAMRLPRDPFDEPYLDLAVAVRADCLVTWNHRHLGYLMDGEAPECLEFRRRFPTLRIVDPITFLKIAVADSPLPPALEDPT